MNSKVKSNKPGISSKKNRFLLRALEPRLLLDAAAVATADAPNNVSDHQDSPQGHTSQGQAPQNSSNELLNALNRRNLSTNPADNNDALATEAPGERTNDIYFVDEAVAASQQLAEQIPQGAEVHFLSLETDGVTRIAEVLENREGIDAIHILSHGSEGELRLGNATLNPGSIDNQYRDLLAGIGGALSDSADILIYGCDFGAGDAGTQAVALLAELTGADITASTDDTGASRLGGDWELETATGKIEAGVLAVEDWDHLLAPPEIDLNSGVTPTEIIQNGDFEDSTSSTATDWTTTGSPVFSAGGGQTAGWSVNEPGTLTQENISGWSSGLAPSGAAQVTFDLAWDNNTIDQSAQMQLSIGGVVYAQFNGVQGGDAALGQITYLNGATGSPDTVQTSVSGTWTVHAITLNLPADVVNTGDLVFTYTEPDGASDDTFRIDNISVLTTDSTIAPDSEPGVDFAVTYVEGGASVSIADTDASVRDNDGDEIQSATIVLTNAEAGDELLIVGSLPAGITGTVDTSVPGQITLSLSGAASASDYASAIQAVNYQNTAAPSETPRIVEVTVNDGLADSATATTTINVEITRPLIDLDTAVAGNDYAAVYDQGSVAIGNAVSVTDAQGDDLISMTITLANATAADSLFAAGTLPTGLSGSYDGGTGVYTITGMASAADYQTATSLIRFATTSGAVGDRTITVEAVSSVAPTASNLATATLTTLDSDGDGVANAGDIDDDNDGIVDEMEDGANFVPSLVDGSMEGAIDVAWEESTNPGSLNSNISGTGWSPIGSPDSWTGSFSLDGSGFWAGALNGVPGAAEGEVFVAIYNGFTDEGMSIEIPVSAGIEIGDEVQISYQQIFGGVNGITTAGQEANFVFTIDGVAHHGSTLTYEGNVVKQWSEDVITFVATSTSPTISITIRPTSPTGGDGNYFGIDDIQIHKVSDLQTASDLDNDGIANRLDIDIDNDGITDNVEAQETAGYIAPSGVDADGDGLDDAYDAAVGDITPEASEGLEPVDTDSDGAADFVDDDSDDDGTLDVAERGDTGPTSITDTTDTDGDGLLDIFEAGDINDGYDPNDENIDGSGIYNLADSDDDTAADGSNANPRGIDLDYRDDPSLVPPDAVDDTASTEEETALTVGAASGLLANDDLGVSAGTVTSVLIDTDNDGVPDTEIPIGVATDILGSQGMIAGSLTVNADGSYSFTPVTDFEGPLPAISYTVTTEGGTGSANLTITVAPVNDAPSLDNSVNLVYQVPEDSPAPSGQVGSLISEFTAGITDIDADAEMGIAIYSRSNSNGIWWYSTDNGTTWLEMDARSTSNALLLADDGQTRIYFQSTTANYHGTANNQLSYVAWDQSDGNPSGTTGVSIGSRGGNTAFSQATDTIARVVTPVNDAPVLNDVNRRLITVNEDTTTSPPSGSVGTHVSYAYFRWSVSDVDTNADMNQRGIAITDSNETDGIWWYTTDNGATWQQIGAVSDDNALLLEFSSSARVYFQANDDFNTGSGNISDALTIRAWDQTSGTNGGRADTTVNGGTTAFSTDTDVVYLDINPVADISNDLSNTTPEDTPITIEPIATDTFEGSNPQIVEIDDQSITPGGPGVAVEGGMVTLDADGQTLTYTPNPDYYANNNDFYYTVSSGGVTERALIRVHVTAVADAPRIDLDTTTEGADYATDYDNGPVAIGNLVSVTDPENNNLSSMTITIPDATADTRLFAEGALPSGLTGSYDAGTGTYTLTGNRSLADYQTALGKIRFENTSGTPGNWTLLVSAISVTAPTDSNTAQADITLLDSDGDGIANAGDIDDDNDGVLDSVEGLEGPQNLVTNGDFTLGDFGFESDLEESMGGAYPSYNGVVANGDTGGNYTATWNPYGSSGGTRPDGSGAYLVTNDIAEAQGQEYAVTWRQTIEVPENTDLTLFFQLTTSGTNLDFLVDGVSLTGGVQNYSHNYDWRDYSFDFNSGERTSITIEFRQHTGGGAGDSGIDNIALLADLSDPDGDGLPNRLDLDSDNDGITDNVEAQTTQDYIHPSGQGAAMTDADGDGLDDVYDADTTDTTESASLGLTPVDTDGDGTPDYHDDDSDDDGTLDIVERGDGQATSITDSTDTDGDGLLDIFEGANINDGYEVNDENLIDTDFNLADQDGDTAADGSNATPTDIDLDYRDNLVSPALDLDGDDSSGATAADYDTTYTEGGPGVAIADGDVAITDFDSVNMVGAAITLGNPETGDRLLVDGSDAASGVLASGISWTRTDTAVTLSGSFSTADYQAALQLVTFMSSNLMPPAGIRLVQVSVNDGTSSSNTATAAITVVPVNNPPVNTLPAGGWTTPEDTAVALDGLSVADEDAGSGTITVTLGVASGTLSAASGGNVTVSGAGSSTLTLSGTLSDINAYLASAAAPVFTPGADVNGDVTLTMTTNDGGNTGGDPLTDVDTGIITVTPVSDAPVAIDDTRATDEDTPISFDPRDNDTDADGDPLTITDINGTPITEGSPVAVDGGSVSLNPDGSLTFTPDDDFNGMPPPFTYTIADGNGGTDEGTINLTVNAVNDAPLNTLPDTQNTLEDGILSFTTVDGNAITVADVEGDTLTVTLTVTNGTLTLSGTSGLTFSSGDGSANTTMTFSGTAMAINAALDGAFYRPIADYNGPAQLDITTSDGTASDSDTLAIAVAPVADIAGDNATTNENLPVEISVFANDTFENPGRVISAVDGTAITAGGPAVAVANGTVSLTTDGNLVYTPTTGFNGDTSFIYRVTSNGATETATVNVAVAAVNAPPVNDLPTSFNTLEDTPVVLDGLSIADNDAGTGTITVTLAVDTGTLSAASSGGVTASGSGTGSLTLSGTLADLNAYLGASSPEFTPAANSTGSVTLTMTSNDNGNTGGPALTDVDTSTITITPVNDAPMGADKTVTVDEDTTYIFTAADFGFSDPNDNPDDNLQAVIINSLPATGTLTLGGAAVTAGQVIDAANIGQLQWTPDAGESGTAVAAFTFQVRDSGGTLNGGQNTDQTPNTITVDVIAVNDAPVNTLPDSFGINEDTALALTGLAIDDVDAGTGNLTITLSVDTGALTVVAGVGVTVTGSGSGAITLTGTLDDLNAWLAATPPEFQPDADFNGTVTLTMLTDDLGNTGSGGALTDTDIADIVVAPVNDPPVAADDAITTAEDTAFSGSLPAAADVDGDTVVYAPGGTAPANGTVAINSDGTYTYTPDPDFNGADSFTYTVSDGTETVEYTVSVTVTPDDDPPVAVDDTQATDEDTPVSFDPRINDTDAEGNPLTITDINGTPITGGNPVVVDGGNVSLNPDGSLTFTPDDHFNGSLNFTYTISDGASTDQARVDITVNPVNDAPVAMALADQTSSDADAISLDLSGFFSDPDGDSLTFTATGLPTGLSMDSTTGVISGTIDNSASIDGPYGVTVTVTDTGGLETSRTFTWTIDNPAPIAANDDLATTENAVALTGSVLTDNGNGPDSDPDNDAISVSAVKGIAANVGTAVTGTGGGTFTINGDGSYSFDPGTAFDDLAEGETRLTTVTYTLSDGEGGVDTATVTVNVIGDNDAPAAADDSFITSEDTSVIFDARLNDSDPDGNDTLTVTQIAGTSIAVGGSVSVTGGTVMLGSDGHLTFTPNPDFNGPTSFSYTVSDGEGSTATAIVNGTVNPLNDDPLAVDDSFSTQEDTPATIGILGNDSDVDGDALTITEINGAPFTVGSPVTVTGGTVTVNADGTLLFEPADEFNGNTSFTYTISDGNGGTVTASVNGTVGAVNDPPTAADTTVTIAEDTAIVGGTLPAATDPDSDPVTYGAGATAPGNGTVTINADGTYDYTPDPDFNGTDTFSYVVSDGNGGVNEYVVTVNVTGVNDQPVADPIENMVRADGETVGIDLSPFFSDPDGDVLTYEVTDLPAGLSFDPGTGEITGTIDPNASQEAPGGVYTVTVTARDRSDGSGLEVTETFDLTVTNPAPTAVADTATTDEDTPVGIDVLTNDSDPDGDPLTVVSAEAGNGTVTIEADGSLTYTPNENFNGTDTITYTIDDDDGGASTAQVTVTVNAINDDPAAADITDFIDNDSTIIAGEDFASYFDDVDGDTLSFGATGLPTGLSMDANGIVSGTIDSSASQGGPDSNGAYSVTVTVNDGNGGVVSRNFTWFIDNLPPTAFNDSLTVSEDDSATGGDVLANDTDPDNDGFGVVAVNGVTTLPATVTGSAGGSFTVNADGTYSFVAGPDFADLQAGETRATSIVYTLQDDDGGEDTATLTVMVTGVNDAPTVVDDGLPDVTRADGASLDAEPLTMADYFHDAEQGSLTFAASNLPPGLSIDTVTGEITGTIENDASVSGPYTVTMTATDDQGEPVSANFVFTVTNPAPTAGNDSVFTPEDTSVDIPVLDNDTDPDGDTLSVVSAEAGSGTVTINPDNTLTYQPNSDFSGTDTIIYHISDGQGGESTAAVTVSVTSDNDTPVIDLDNIAAGLDYAATFTEGDAPIPVANGDASAFDVEDEIVNLDVTLGGFSDGAAELIHIGDTTLVTGTVASGTATFGGTTFAYDYSPVDGLTFVNAAGPDVPMTGDDLSMLLRGLGYENTTDDPTAGDRTLAFIATDALGASSASAVATISVVPVNDAPLTADDTQVTDENTPVSGNVLDNDGDVDGGTLTVSAVNGAGGSVGVLVAGSGGGQFSINADGSYSFDPGTDFDHLGPGESATTSITYTAADGQGGTATAVLTITVNGLNNAPVGADDAIVTTEDMPFSGQLPQATDVDEDPLFYAVGSQPGNGTVTVNGDGSYQYTPDPDFNGLDSFTYTVSDGIETITHTVNVTVNPANDPPVAVNDAAATDENTSIPLGTGNLLPNDDDIDGDTLTISAVNGAAGSVGMAIAGPEGGQFNINADGSYSFDPGTDFDDLRAGENAATSIQYTVSDGQGGTATATLTITVNGLNDGPIASDDAITVDENTSATGNVVFDAPGQDTDTDGDVLSVSGVNGAAGNVNAPVTGSNGGTFTIESDGSFSFDPGTDFNDLAEGMERTTTVTYTIDDGNGGEDTATLTVTVTGVNSAPTASSIPSRTDVDNTTVSLLAGNAFTDAESDTLNYSATGLPPGLSIDPNTGEITGTIDSSASGPAGTRVYNVSVTADDGNGGIISRRFDWTITNPGPAAVDDSFSIVEDTPSLAGDVIGNDTDPDGDPLNATLVTGPGNGSLTLNANGTFSYTPDADFKGTDSFVYQIDDGNGGTSTATVSIGVTGVNDAPSGTDKVVTIDEDTTYTFNIADFGFTDTSDPGDSLVQVTITSLPPNGLLSLDGVPVTAGQVVDAMNIALLAFAPDPDASGTDYASFTFQVSDGTDVDSTPNTFTFNVNPVNDAPLNTMPASYYGQEDMPVLLTGLAIADIDAESGTVGVTLSVDSGSLAAAAAGGVLVNGAGTDTLVLEGSLANLNAYLAGTNAPVFTPAANTNDPVTLTMISNDRGNTGSGGVLTDTRSALILTTAVNDQPTANNTALTTPEDTPVSDRVRAEDVDGDTLTFTLVNQPENGTVSLNPDGTYLFTPNPDFVGEVAFDVIVDDGHGGTATATQTITVTPVNDEPIARDTEIITPEDTPIDGVLPDATDIDGDPITYGTGSQPDHGSVTINPDGTYTYIPNADYQGFDSFTYTITDGVATVTYTVSVTVTGINDVPVAVDDSVSTIEGIPVTLNLLGNDSDPDASGLNLQSINGVALTPGEALRIPVAGGVVMVAAGGGVRFVSDTGYNGSVGFDYEIQDGEGDSDTGRVIIEVLPPLTNPSPIDPEVNPYPRANHQSNEATDSRPDNQPPLEVEGVLVNAVNDIANLGDITPLGAEEVILRAVNDINELEQGEEAAGNTSVWQSSRLDQLFTPGVATGVLTGSATSPDGKIEMEMKLDSEQAWFYLNDLVPEDEEGITNISISLPDGEPLPVWIQVQPTGDMVINRPADLDSMVLYIDTERSDQEVIRYQITVDFNAVELTAEIVEDSPPPESGSDQAARSMTFGEQLAQASSQRYDMGTSLREALQ